MEEQVNRQIVRVGERVGGGSSRMAGKESNRRAGDKQAISR